MRLRLLFDNNSQSVIMVDWVFEALDEDKNKCLIICTNNGTFMVSNITDADAINILAEESQQTNNLVGDIANKINEKL